MNPVEATQSIRERRWLGYALAVALTLVALWVRLQAGGLFQHSPFLLFLIAVALSAFLGGLGPGVLAALLSALLADYYLIPPLHDFALAWPQGAIQMGAFVLVAITIILLIHGVLTAHEIRRHSEARLIGLNTEL